MQISTSINPGEVWFGYKIPEIDEGNQLLRVTTQCDYIEKVSDSQTKYIGIMGLDF